MQAKLFRRIEIHVVKPRAAQGDKFYAMLFQLFQHRAAGVVIHENTHAVTAVSGFSGPLGQQKVIKFDIVTIPLVNVL